MKSVFITELKPLLDAVSEQMELFVPEKVDQHYVYCSYDGSGDSVEFNDVRTCTPVKEFLFPVRELAATYPTPLEPEQTRPFAVFGLKDCDLQSLKVLDKVFAEEEFLDPFYVSRRESMFIIAGDCAKPCDGCF